MKRFVVLVLLGVFLCAGCASKRVQIQSADQQVVVDDRYNDILQADLPPEVKERLLNELMDAEEKSTKSILDWIIQFVTLGASIYAGVEAATN